MVKRTIKLLTLIGLSSTLWAGNSAQAMMPTLSKTTAQLSRPGLQQTFARAIGFETIINGALATLCTLGGVTLLIDHQATKQLNELKKANQNHADQLFRVYNEKLKPLMEACDRVYNETQETLKQPITAEKKTNRVGNNSVK